MCATHTTHTHTTLTIQGDLTKKSIFLRDKDSLAHYV